MVMPLTAAAASLQVHLQASTSLTPAAASATADAAQATCVSPKLAPSGRDKQ